MSDYLRELIAQAEAGFDWDAEMQELIKVTPTERNAVKRDRFDQMTWNSMTSSTPALTDSIDRVGADFEQAPPAFEDLFNLLYQGNPRFVDADAVLPEYLANLDLLRCLANSEEFKSLREDTVYDDYATTFALLTMEQQIRAAFEAVKDKRAAQREAAQQQAQAQQGLSEALQQARQALQDNSGDDQAAEALQQALQASKAAQQAQAQAQAQHQVAAHDANVALNTGAARAKADLNAQQKLLDGYGVEDGELKRMDFDTRKRLVERFSKGRVAHFAKIIGAFRAFAEAERRRKVQHAPAEVHNVELGNDLTRLTATELTHLAVPELEEMFWIRHARHELLIKTVRGDEKQGQGSIVMVCDESGSMSAPVDSAGNSREAWSKALTLALMDQARRRNRDFTYIGFSSNGSIWQCHLPGGRGSIEQVLDIVEHHYGGGTAYEGPLALALELVAQQARDGKPRADVVFATDDECRVPHRFIEEFQQARKDCQTKVYGIQIGTQPRSGSAMHSLCDHVLSVTKLTADPEAMKDIFRQI